MADAARLAALLATFDSSTPTMTLFRIAPGIRLVGPAVDGVAVLLVMTGTMILEVEGDAPRTVAPGSMALISSHRPTRLSPAGPPVTSTLESRTCLTSRDGWLVADATRAHDPALVVAASRIAGSTAIAGSGTLVLPVATDPIARPIFAQMRAECDREAGGLPALATALMSACVVQVLRRSIAALPEASPAPAHRGLIARAVAAVRTRPAEAHTVDTLAAVAGMSRSTFIRHFKRAFRVAPSEYVQQVRLEEARTMLLSTDLPIKAIAARAGFASRSHFSRMFRTTFGHDPSGYREHIRETP